MFLSNFTLMKLNYFFIIFFVFNNLNAQVAADSVMEPYLEDQIYVTLKYNLLKDKPSEVSQNGFSGGISFGFIKDLPINTERTIGFGIGVGYSYNAIISNLQIAEDNLANVTFSIVDNYKYNRLKTHAIEVPIEFRWRNSTNTKYKFWRLYGGLNLIYTVINKAEFKDDFKTLTAKNFENYNKFQSALFVAAGYSTWNLYINYGLIPFFKNSNLITGEKVNMSEFTVGLRFYIL